MRVHPSTNRKCNASTDPDDPGGHRDAIANGQRMRGAGK